MSLGFRVTGNSLVLKVEKQEKTEAGIYIPEVAQKDELFVEVIGVGPDVKTIKEGDWIMISPFARPVRFDLNSTNYIVVSEFDAMVIKE